jgi:hypothetical protein
MPRVLELPLAVDVADLQVSNFPALCPPQHRVAAVERLCDTEKAQETGATTAAAGAFAASSKVSGAGEIY